MNHIRLMLWCPGCLSGVHVPAFRAAADGLFTERGLDVEFVDASTVPDYSLSGFAARPRAVVSGEVDFAITSVAYVLAALRDAGGVLPARFAAVFHQRNPVVGVVLDESDITGPGDLCGRPTADWALGWFAREYEAALARAKLGSARMVAAADTAYAARELTQGLVDVVPTWADTLPIMRAKVQRPLRAVPISVEVYASGLLAADRLPTDVVMRMRNALAEAFERERRAPGAGVAAFVQRFPHIPAEDVRWNWTLFERSGLAEQGFGAMNGVRWRDTVDHTAAAQNLPPVDPTRLYRPELAAVGDP